MKRTAPLPVIAMTVVRGIVITAAGIATLTGAPSTQHDSNAEREERSHFSRSPTPPPRALPVNEYRPLQFDQMLAPDAHISIPR
jgi:hypothetical protein